MDKSKVYITSDLHFYHRNIIKYCNRPYSMDWHGINQMNEDILKEFDKLPDDCIIINNGDLCLNSQTTFNQLKAIVDRMKGNGRKLWIILGNHDREIQKFIKEHDYKTPTEFFTALGFDRVFPFPILIDNLLLSHEPVYLGKKPVVNPVVGHIHDIDVDKDYFNHSCENWAMMERVKKEGITNQINLDIDTSALNRKDLSIDPRYYYNVCWDRRKKIMKFSEIEEYFSKLRDHTKI